MRFPSLLLALCLFASVALHEADSQLTFGSNGLRMPPINLATVFRLLKRTWNMIVNPKKTNKPEARIAPEEAAISTSKEESESEREKEKSEREKEREKEREQTLTDEERIFLYDLKIKVNLSCKNGSLDCNSVTLNDFLTSENITLDQQQQYIIRKIKNTTSLDFPITDFVHLSSNNTVSDLEQKLLRSEPKTPSFLPFPFASGGWIVSYIVLNSVLLGLYVFLAGPYFVSGRTVERFVIDKESDVMSDAELDQVQNQYMGYTTYGDTDMMMNYMMAEEEEEEGEGGWQEEEGKYNEVDEETLCVENMLCQHPAYGARALSSTNFVLRLLEWVPGIKYFGSKFKRHVNRLGEAVSNGRQNQCQHYQCPTKRTG